MTADATTPNASAGGLAAIATALQCQLYLPLPARRRVVQPLSALVPRDFHLPLHFLHGRPASLQPGGVSSLPGHVHAVPSCANKSPAALSE